MKENKLKTFLNWLLVATIFLLPIFFLPYIANPFVNSKLLLIFSITLVSLFSFAIISLQEKSFRIIKTPFAITLLLFIVLILISSVVNYQYPNKQLFGLGGVYLSLGLLILLLPSLLKDKMNGWFILANNLAAIVLSVLAIFQLFGIGLADIINRLSILRLPNNLAFSLSGATFVTIQFLTVVLLANIFDQKAWRASLFNKIATLIITIGLGISIWSVLPGGEASFQNLPFNASLSIAKNSLAVTKNALFGYGPDSYGNAYSILKPLWINGANYWKFTFDSAFNLPLTLIVSLGVIACLIYLLFLWQTFVSVKNSAHHNTFLKVFIISTIIWQFFAPVNVLMLILFAFALSFLVKSDQDRYAKIEFNTHHFGEILYKNKWAKTQNYIFLSANILLISLASLTAYIGIKTFVAYHLLYKSSASINRNEIAKAYDYNKQAKNLAPKIDLVRRNYSLLNLQIAIALSNKTNITPAEQEQVLQLVNQAIREARATTVLDPLSYQNWSILAQVYMQLVSTTKQAKQEAFNALARAATYNPNDPEIRIILGQLFQNDNQYPEAITFFGQAVARKPDMFIANYYLAKALTADGQLKEAKNSLITSLNLLDKESEEHQIVSKELDLLGKRIEENDQKTTQSKQVNKPLGDNPNTTPEASQSSLSNLLDQKDTEAVIQNGALSSDQNLIEN